MLYGYKDGLQNVLDKHGFIPQDNHKPKPTPKQLKDTITDLLSFGNPKPREEKFLVDVLHTLEKAKPNQTLQLSQQTHDFKDGKGPVSAHRHTNPDGSVGGWVAYTATVESTVFVGPDAQVYHNAIVFNRAKVFGNAKVFGDAEVYGNAKVFGNARVYDNAKVFGDAEVYGYALVVNNAKVYDNAEVCGDATVYGDAEVYGNARAYGNAILTKGTYKEGYITK